MEAKDDSVEKTETSLQLKSIHVQTLVHLQLISATTSPRFVSTGTTKHFEFAPMGKVAKAHG